MLQKLRRLYRIYTGKSPNVAVGVRCQYVWYGNEYGGFYVCTEALPAAPVVYSIGIGKDISFDEAMMRVHGARIFAFDPTPDSITWIKNQTLGEESPNFAFYPFGIGAQTGEATFYLPQNPQHVSGSILPTSLTDASQKINVPLKRLADMVQMLGHSHIDVLKMDIEGAEYEVLPDVLQTDVSISQLLLEFHGRVLGHHKTIEAVRLLKEKGYEIFAISQGGEEISFIKREIL